ncbi:MAG: hypothetical protein RBS72_15470 [Sedimentisphaerales bacterium]|jgi:hypothetical protein|nr:hypothetical protein [Sedimentisphaerales bacterium]HNY78978.1 hypothetical protein [Sedimentisphaerales bacterium]HOC64073.1 hypothetical protein [Sedimentisphaerales bacterium]HOH64892.1 hypothetical protein [Sedimentisphaerales bacterium]HPY49563.1 hypothetical protein [Sedimentisphaerales bacterium]
MKRKLQVPIVVVLFLLVCLIPFSGAGQTASESYYAQLKSLVTGRHILRVRPNASAQDVSLIEVEKGAAGVLFGATMDDVIAIWGKPNSLMIDGIGPVWDLGIGACRFGFVNNRLVTISVHSATIEKAYLPNGLSFESSYEEVESAFGEPIEAADLSLEFATENGYLVRFHFVPDLHALGKRKLINIEICHPDSGE